MVILRIIKESLRVLCCLPCVVFIPTVLLDTMGWVPEIAIKVTIPTLTNCFLDNRTPWPECSKLPLWPLFPTLTTCFVGQHTPVFALISVGRYAEFGELVFAPGLLQSRRLMPHVSPSFYPPLALCPFLIQGSSLWFLIDFWCSFY